LTNAIELIVDGLAENRRSTFLDVGGSLRQGELESFIRELRNEPSRYQAQTMSRRIGDGGLPYV